MGSRMIAEGLFAGAGLYTAAALIMMWVLRLMTNNETPSSIPAARKNAAPMSSRMTLPTVETREQILALIQGAAGTVAMSTGFGWAFSRCEMSLGFEHVLLIAIFFTPIWFFEVFGIRPPRQDALYDAMLLRKWMLFKAIMMGNVVGVIIFGVLVSP